MTTETKYHKAIVKQINSGDTIVIHDSEVTAERAPEKRTLILSNITAGKLATKAGESDEPFAWEAREYLRKKLIGNEVHVTYDQEVVDPSDKIYGNVFYPKNITKDLVLRGYVSVRREGAWQTSPNIQKLIKWEDKAKNDSTGIWSGEVSRRTLKGISEIVSKYKKEPVVAVVELVEDASTLEVLLLEDFVMITTFTISGIQIDDEFEDEARFFVEELIMQRDVEVIIESVNKSSTIVTGSVIHRKGNVAELLLKEGLGTAKARAMATVTNGERLREAEKQAKENKVRRWREFQKPTDAKVDYQTLFHQEKKDKEEVKKELGKLEERLEASKKLLQKVAVCGHLRTKLETYEFLLSDFSSKTRLRDYNSQPPELNNISIIDVKDKTVRKSFCTHYNKWMDILEHSRDSRMRGIRKLIRDLNFRTNESFARYISILFIHLSNLIHNVPSDIVTWENENSVVEALRQWNINDARELNAVRCLYRIPTIE